MYDEETGAFYDRLFDGSLTKVLSPTSFLPMFVKACTKEQAEKMVQSIALRQARLAELERKELAARETEDNDAD